MKHYSDVLVRPWVTEKGMDYTAGANTYPFEVRADANKIEIKQAVEEAYKGQKVTVVRVRTMIVPGKPRNFRRMNSSTTRARKKALVTLKEGDHIDFL